MKKLSIFLVVIIVLLSAVVGCGKKEVSSAEEALFATRELPNFKEMIHYISVKGYGEYGPFHTDSFLIGGAGVAYHAAHVVVYMDKNNATRVVTWDEQRPPQQIETGRR